MRKEKYVYAWEKGEEGCHEKSGIIILGTPSRRSPDPYHQY